MLMRQMKALKPSGVAVIKTKNNNTKRKQLEKFVRKRGKKKFINED